MVDLTPLQNPLRDGKTAPRILIVEDDTDYAVQLMAALKRVDANDAFSQIDIAPDVKSALAYLDMDVIDIYIVDLKLVENAQESNESKEIGKRLIKKILEASNAGLIVHSTLPVETEAEALLDQGADDYLHKTNPMDVVRAKVLALWRRVQLTRPKPNNKTVHKNRTFLVGNWRFVIGSRQLKDGDGNAIRISPTEHAFLRYICTVEGHEIERKEFNVGVLGRGPLEEDKRIDNLVYRLREKLGGTFQLLPVGGGAYKLLDVKELRVSLNSSRK